MGLFCGGRPRVVTPVQKGAIKSAGFRLHTDDEMGLGCRGRPRAVTSVQKGAMKGAGFRLPQFWRSNLNILLHGMPLNFIKKINCP